MSWMYAFSGMTWQTISDGPGTFRTICYCFRGFEWLLQQLRRHLAQVTGPSRGLTVSGGVGRVGSLRPLVVELQHLLVVVLYGGVVRGDRSQDLVHKRDLSLLEVLCPGRQATEQARGAQK